MTATRPSRPTRLCASEACSTQAQARRCSLGSQGLIRVDRIREPKSCDERALVTSLRRLDHVHSRSVAARVVLCHSLLLSLASALVFSSFPYEISRVFTVFIWRARHASFVWRASSFGEHAVTLLNLRVLSQVVREL